MPRVWLQSHAGVMGLVHYMLLTPMLQGMGTQQEWPMALGLLCSLQVPWCWLEDSTGHRAYTYRVTVAVLWGQK